ncbi:MAG: radical SAM protein, partial [Spirochaetia bacterium]|nr:radical SAM protein [Spirochaetia bacterium]
MDPVRALGDSLLEVRKPSRYLGGEYGAVRKEGEGLLDIALCFPDLYEIGMSNNALRILYSGLNALEDVRCERVFAPAPDFEALLAKKGLPLYTLETGMPVRECDLVA